jgi:hypothetical protein
MMPLNAILIGRVRGILDSSRINDALELLTKRHPHLAVRVEIDSEGAGWYVDEGVPKLAADVHQRVSGQQWLDHTLKELHTPLPIETGPLFRCTLIHSPHISEIVLCAHHIISDGMSLGYLLRDLLTLHEEPETPLPPSTDPPRVDSSTASTPPRAGWIFRSLTGMANRSWEPKQISFGEDAMRRMHREFWKKNDQVHVIAWSLSEASTAVLAKRCRQEKVTVTSALLTSFLAAQYDVQGHEQRCRRRVFVGTNIREKLIVPVEEAFGCYASSITPKLPYNPRLPFWQSARRVHSKFTRCLTETNPFRLLSSDWIHPTLLDAPYFCKYGLLDEPLPTRMLRWLGWDKVTFGFALSNVGRFDIPTSYGQLELETVYGPCFYCDFTEKTLGTITVGGALSFILVCNTSLTGDGARIKKAAMEHLQKAVGVTLSSQEVGVP